MTTFVALYRGDTIAGARLIALSADPTLVADVSGRLLQERTAAMADPVVEQVERGRKAALRLIKQEATNATE